MVGRKGTLSVSAAALGAFVVVLAGCGGTVDQAVVASGAATPDRPGYSRAEPRLKPPAAEVACRSHANGTVQNRAATEIQSLGWSEAGRFHRSYTGLGVGGGTIEVYRMPNPKLDRAVRRIAAARKICVEFVDTPISRWHMERLTRKIHDRDHELRAAGAPIDSISRQVVGQVVVGVNGDVDAARRILGDLEHVTVVFSRGVPL